MNAKRHFVMGLAAVLASGSTAALSQGAPAAAPATGQTQNGEAPIYSNQQLDALMAPIALYPDSLLSQILMASTYPLEIVQAARWSTSTGNKGGDAAVIKVDSQPWDPSVKSLVAFPNVLTMMNEQLGWTQNVGDAFLAQQADVLDSIQRLRRQAQNAGNLNSNTQQNIVQQGQTIVIQPTQPEVIYVPAYNPTAVYGTWAYPSYPPAYYPGVMSWYPGQAMVSGLMFGAGVAVAGAMFGGFNWGNGYGNSSVNVNVNNYKRYDRTYSGNNNHWQHNPQHRGAVAYRDPSSRKQYSNHVAGSEARKDMRGYGDGANRSGVQNRTQDVDRSAAKDRAQSVDRSAAQNRSQGSHTAAASTTRGDAFKGVGSGNGQQQVDRGRASSAAANRSSGNHTAGSGQRASRGGGGRGR